MKFNFRGITNWFGKGCQSAKGTQDTESSISNDALKPDGVLIRNNKKTSYNFLRLIPTHVILMNDFSEALT